MVQWYKSGMLNVKTDTRNITFYRNTIFLEEYIKKIRNINMV